MRAQTHPHMGMHACVRACVLQVLDANYSAADKEGCTPLHWAAIKGNGEACTVLLQGGASAVLGAKDVTGSTPAQLAVEKGHRCVMGAWALLRFRTRAGSELLHLVGTRAPAGRWRR